MLASTRMMTSLLWSETAAPPSHFAPASSSTRPARPMSCISRFCPAESLSKRRKRAPKQPQAANCMSAAIGAGRDASMPGRRFASAMAKRASSTQRCTMPATTAAVDSPFSSSRRRIASGKAAPIEKRKNGKTRSTHVMPGTLGSNRKSGGGSWAWKSHAGRSLCQSICPDSTIPTMASPRSRSMESARVPISAKVFQFLEVVAPDDVSGRLEVDAVLRQLLA